MDYASYLIVFRGFERLLIVVSGLTSVLLGYRLFKSIPDYHGSQGKFEAIKASVTISKVGPGIFFALFGSFVLWRSIDAPMSVP